MKTEERKTVLAVSDRVKYIGLSVQVAQSGELGVVMELGGHHPDGAPKSGLPGMVWVGWDLGGGSWCWPAELEIVPDSEPDHAIGLHAAQRRTRQAEAALIERLRPAPVQPDLDVYPDFDSYRRVAEDIATMEARPVMGPHSRPRCPVCGGLNPGDVTHARC